MKEHRDRIAELTRERIDIVPYDERWPQRYHALETKLQRSLPLDLVTRIAHIGSTAVPGLSAKPIIDVQVEVVSLDRVRRDVVPVMDDLGYEYIWRPTMGERAPFYAWFIGRDARGERTEHVHMVQPDQASVDRLIFRDHLRAHPEEALRYEALKRALHAAHPNDRAAYTIGKTDYITGVVAQAKTERS
jgi:GrpB-like predicted nucleotidyltransferase (UPF0157 family)